MREFEVVSLKAIRLSLKATERANKRKARKRDTSKILTDTPNMEERKQEEINKSAKKSKDKFETTKKDLPRNLFK